MALTKTRSSALLSNVTVSASSTSSNSTTEDLSTAIACAIEVKLTFNASATLGATVKVYSSGDDSNYDTGPYDEFDIPFPTGGGTVQYTFPIIPSPKYVKIAVQNLDTGQSITALYVYTHLQEVT